MYKRHIMSNLLAALSDTPVVFLNGARQAGKSTLAKQLISNEWPATYVNLDNVSTLAAIHSDPLAFIHNNPGPLIIDEIQRAVELLLPIKEAVDNKRIAGRFLLTGSANILLLPQMSDSLAGRMEIATLWPLSQGEIKGVKESFIARIFQKKMLPLGSFNKMTREQLLSSITLGGYPEVLSRPSYARQYEWFNSYITAILQRDIRELANVEGLMVFPKLLSLLAARASSLLNYAELSRASGISHTTLLRYVALLQAAYLIHMVLPWSNNKGKHMVKSPKIYLTDTGLLAHLLNTQSSQFMEHPSMMGAILENFIVMELQKQLGWSEVRAKLFHYRTHSGQEVDLVLEDTSGLCVGIEIKASTTLSQNDFKGLRSFSEHLGKKFLRGVILYTGDQFLSFGEEFYAVPISALWSESGNLKDSGSM